MEEEKKENEDIKSNIEISKDLRKINAELRKVKKTYSTVVELYKFFTKKEDNIKNIVEKSKQANLDLIGVQANICNSQNEINKIIENIKEKNTEIDKFFTDISTYRANIDDEENGAKKVFADIDELNLEINTSKKYLKDLISNFKNSLTEHTTSIENTKEEILKKKIQIENNEKEMDDDISKIFGYKSEAKNMIGEIGKIFDLARDTGLANSFDSRRKRVSKSVLLWLSILLFSIVFLLVWVYYLFSQENINNIFLLNKIEEPYFKFVFKLTLSSPLIFAVWFSSIQYAKERYILEQYEYKTATALALEQYSKLLENKFGEEYDDGKFEFITDLINKVYKETDYPKHGAGFEGKFNVPFLKKVVEVKSKAEEIKE